MPSGAPGGKPGGKTPDDAPARAEGGGPVVVLEGWLPAEGGVPGADDGEGGVAEPPLLSLEAEEVASRGGGLPLAPGGGGGGTAPPPAAAAAIALFRS